MIGKIFNIEVKLLNIIFIYKFEEWISVQDQVPHVCIFFLTSQVRNWENKCSQIFFCALYIHKYFCRSLFYLEIIIVIQPPPIALLQDNRKSTSRLWTLSSSTTVSTSFFFFPSSRLFKCTNAVSLIYNYFNFICTISSRVCQKVWLFFFCDGQVRVFHKNFVLVDLTFCKVASETRIFRFTATRYLYDI